VVKLGVSFPLDESRQQAIHLLQIRVQRVIGPLLRAVWGQSFPGEDTVPLIKPLQRADDLIGWVLHLVAHPSFTWYSNAAINTTSLLS